jgi:hypothetical protein
MAQTKAIPADFSVDPRTTEIVRRSGAAPARCKELIDLFGTWVSERQPRFADWHYAFQVFVTVQRLSEAGRSDGAEATWS